MEQAAPNATAALVPTDAPQKTKGEQYAESFNRVQHGTPDEKFQAVGCAVIDMSDTLRSQLADKDAKCKFLLDLVNTLSQRVNLLQQNQGGAVLSIKDLNTGEVEKQQAHGTVAEKKKTKRRIKESQQPPKRRQEYRFSEDELFKVDTGKLTKGKHLDKKLASIGFKCKISVYAEHSKVGPFSYWFIRSAKMSDILSKRQAAISKKKKELEQEADLMNAEERKEDSESETGEDIGSQDSYSDTDTGSSL